MAKFYRDVFTANKIKTLVDKGEIRFDIPLQRGLVWTNSQKYSLIDSILKNYPIGQIYELKLENHYQTLEGQQRLTTIVSYMNNEFAIKGDYSVVLDNGQEESLNRRKYSDLPKEVQDRIAEYNTDIIYVEEVSEDEVVELFERLNGGKPLTNIEKTKARTKSLQKVNAIASHAIFDDIMTELAKNQSANIGFVMHVYSILFNESKCLLDSKVKVTLRNKKISKQEFDKVMSVLDIYKAAFDKIKLEGNNTLLVKKLKRKTHFVSVAPVVEYVLDNNIELDNFISWLKAFFSSEGKTTISDTYNATVKSSANSEMAVKARIEEVLKSFKAYMAGETVFANKQ